MDFELDRSVYNYISNRFSLTFLSFHGTCRFGAWQYLADLPYNQVSEAAIWRLLWKMHLSEESEGSNLDTLTTPECIEQIRSKLC